MKFKSKNKKFEYIVKVPSDSLTSDPLDNSFYIARKLKGYNTFEKTMKQLYTDFDRGYWSLLKFPSEDLDTIVKIIKMLQKIKKKQ